ncbi:MAG: hypothetical protein LC785_17915 [Acidobacteria bacterium]|nr:hypothetical protein [Acidobacteriota bacterium]
MSRPAGTRDRFEDYVPVAERIVKFYERFPEGRIVTHIIEHDRDSGFVLIRAEVYRNADDASPAATGHAYEFKDAGYVQRTSYIEVAETSAVGRSLAFLNFETKRGIASREEMEKASRMAQKEIHTHQQTDSTLPATEEQKANILLLLEQKHPKDRRAQRKLLADLTGKQSRDDLTQEEAQGLIKNLKKAT